jgi:hypothetical protein
LYWVGTAEMDRAELTNKKLLAELG